MNLSNYMSNIVSEVQQFGRAYVDSIVSTSEGKDHEGYDNNNNNNNNNKSNVEIEIKQNVSREELPFLTTLQKTFKKDNEGKEFLLQSDVTTTLSSKNTNNITSSLDSHESNLVEREEKKLQTSTEIEASNFRKIPVKKGKASRSKFGAIKIELDSNGVSTLEKLSISQTITPPNSNSLNKFAKKDPINVNKNNNNNNKSDFFLPESQYTSVLAVKSNEESKETTKSSINDKISINKINENWFKQRSRVLQLSQHFLQKERIRIPVISKRFKEVFHYFVEKVVNNALSSVIKEVSNKNFVLNTNTNISSSSLKKNLLGMCYEIEISLRHYIYHIIPHNIFGVSKFNNNNTNAIHFEDSEILKNINSIYNIGGIRFKKTVHDTLEKVQKWKSDERKGIKIILSESNIENEMKNFFEVCYTPLLKVVAEESYEKIQSNILQQQEPKSNNENNKEIEIEIWLKDIMKIFCEGITDSEESLQRFILGETINFNELNLSKYIDLNIAEITLQNGTLALWLMREITILTLLVIWVLYSFSK